MDINIKKLMPEHIDDYIHFFDVTPHATNKEEHKCYCVWWCNDDCEGKDFTSSVEIRKDWARHYIKNNNIQGYLAYYNNTVIGWCNANTKLDCLKCFCWRNFMGSIPIEDPKSGIKVKSIFCLTISPEMRRKGIAKLLVDRVCKDAIKDGFDIVEAYSNKEFIDEADDFMGPTELYMKNGFTIYYETEQKYVMRKQLK